MIVASYKTKRGATVMIADDYMAPIGSNEERRVVEDQRRVAHEILTAWTTRKERQYENDKSACYGW